MGNSVPTLHAYLSYRDAPAAIAWLCALGFEITTRHDAPDGSVFHAEARLGAAVVIVASFDNEYNTPRLMGRSVGNGLYLRTDEVDAMYERAMAAGATSVFPPEATDWGTRRARVLDPGGHEWSFASYEPGRAHG